MHKPVWVKVHWSESNTFADNELIPFKEFEKRCRSLAMKIGYDKGYYKTKCVILFDTGAQYELRLDLAENDDHGFEHRAKATISYYKNKEKDVYVEFLETIDWNS